METFKRFFAIVLLGSGLILLPLSIYGIAADDADLLDHLLPVLQVLLVVRLGVVAVDYVTEKRRAARLQDVSA